jgi:hypothetical protein
VRKDVFLTEEWLIAHRGKSFISLKKTHII